VTVGIFTQAIRIPLVPSYDSTSHGYLVFPEESAEKIRSAGIVTAGAVCVAVCWICPPFATVFSVECEMLTNTGKLDEFDAPHFVWSMVSVLEYEKAPNACAARKRNASNVRML
jgi:hypothetical protein